MVKEEERIFQGIVFCPGDPELVTLKAVRTLKACPAFAAPRTKSGEMLALDIAKKAAELEDKLILPISFSMTRDEERRRAEYEAGIIREALHQTRRPNAAAEKLSMSPQKLQYRMEKLGLKENQKNLIK